MKNLIVAIIMFALLATSWAANLNQTTLEVHSIYLKNSSTNASINYPKINKAYRCYADVYPPDNKSIFLAKWIVTAPGVAFNQSAIQDTDKQAWRTNTTITPNAEGTINCSIQVTDTVGNFATLTKTFTVTTPIPGCNDTDVCTVSSSQAYAAASSAPTSRYLNIIINSGQTLTAPMDVSSNAGIGLILEADNFFNNSGTVLAIGGGSVSSTNCIGGASGSLSIHARELSNTGTIMERGGLGNNSCTSTTSSANGGSTSTLSIIVQNGSNTGSILSLGGNPGKFAYAGEDFGWWGGDAGTISITAYDSWRQAGGIINVTGGNGTKQADTETTCSPYRRQASAGGTSGGIALSGGRFFFTGGLVYMKGGTGGAGPVNTTCYGYSQCGGTGGAALTSNINIKAITNGIAWVIQGGTGGAAPGRYVFGSGTGTYKGGNGGTAYGSVHTHNNMTAMAATITNTGGAGGTGSPIRCDTGTDPSSNPGSVGSTTNHVVHYAWNASADDLSLYFLSGATITQDATPQGPPLYTLSFTYPTNNLSLPTVPNLTLTWSVPDASYNTTIQVSVDNKSWFPAEGIYVVTPWTYTGANISNISVSLNRLTGYVYYRGCYQYNGMYTSWRYVYVNATPTNTSASGYRVPSTENVTSSIMDFYCNFTRVLNATHNVSVYNAPVYVNINGVNYSTTFVISSQLYWYHQVSAPGGGTSNWSCIGWKPNYQPTNSSTGNFTYGEFTVDLPWGVTEVRFLCPFPTFNGITPWGQTAGIGIFKFRNLNTSVLHNYSLATNETVNGTSIFSRLKWNNTAAIANGNATDSTNITTTPVNIILNLNSTNATAYVWLYVNCLNTTNLTLNFSRIYKINQTG